MGDNRADLPKCSFADDLEQPEVKESDLAVKVDGLRATANGPHGVVEREDEDGFRTGGQGRITGVEISRDSLPLPFRPQRCPKIL